MQVLIGGGLIEDFALRKLFGDYLRHIKDFRRVYRRLRNYDVLVLPLQHLVKAKRQRIYFALADDIRRWRSLAVVQDAQQRIRIRHY